MGEGNHKPRVSVGMPVYNSERYVAQAIESHLRQTFTDFELIISDNASTDRSGEICRSFADKDPRIKYHRFAENIGAAGNFRQCFQLAQGEYFRWTPSDDLVGPDLLKLCFEVLDRDPSVVLAYGQTTLIDDEGRILREHDENLHVMADRPSGRFQEVQSRLRLCNIHYGLMRREVLRKTGLIRNYAGGDIPLILELSLYGKFYEVSQHLFFRRMHATASSSMVDQKDVMALYDPKKREKIFFYNWAQLGANILSIARAPISLAEKFRTYTYLARSFVWGRRAYLKDLTNAAVEVRRKFTNS
jgi:glycosyltransferase involved in cell wall biosynthesis